MTIVGIWLLGFIGRRRMLIIGFSGVVGSQALLAVVFMLPQSDAVSYTILAAMMLFVAFVQCFIGTCVWLLLSEIFPIAIRGFAMGIAVFALWTVNAAISFLFPILVVALGSTGTFAVFVLVNVLSLVFVAKFVPETMGQSLEELEVHFRTGALPIIVPPRRPARLRRPDEVPCPCSRSPRFIAADRNGHYFRSLQGAAAVRRPLRDTLAARRWPIVGE